MSLEDLRKKIDEADTKIARLLAERIRIAEEMGKEKEKQGKQIEDKEREKRVLEKVRSIAQKENVSPNCERSLSSLSMASRKMVSASENSLILSYSFSSSADTRKDWTAR